VRREEKRAIETAMIALAMAFCAGFVDTAAYYELLRLYTSHMTGNTAPHSSHLIWRTPVGRMLPATPG